MKRAGGKTLFDLGFFSKRLEVTPGDVAGVK